MIRQFSLLLLSFCWLLVAAPSIHAAILVNETFTRRVVSFDPATGVPTTFAALDAFPGAGFPLLSGIVYSPSNDSIYVSELDRAPTNAGGRIHQFNARTGSRIAVQSFGFGTSGLAVDASGNLAVGDFGSNQIRRLDASLSPLSGTITTPVPGTGGVAFAANGDLIFSTFGGGVYRNGASGVTQVSDSFAPSAQIAIDSSQNLYIGHGLGFSNAVTKLGPSGAEIGPSGAEIGSPFITISAAMIDSAGGNSLGTSPSGVAIDVDGNLIVSAQGNASPGNLTADNMLIPERGGLFKFDTNGNLLQTLAVGSRALGGIAIVPTAIPEPASLLVLAGGAVAMALRQRRRRLTS